MGSSEENKAAGGRKDVILMAHFMPCSRLGVRKGLQALASSRNAHESFKAAYPFHYYATK